MEERAHIYLLRLEHPHLKEWGAKAKEGDETAKLVLSLARKALSHLRTEPWGCACCDREFLADDDVPKKVKTSMGMVCRECSVRDDQWIIHQGIHRKGLSDAPARPGDSIH